MPDASQSTNNDGKTSTNGYTIIRDVTVCVFDNYVGDKSPMYYYADGVTPPVQSGCVSDGCNLSGQFCSSSDGNICKDCDSGKTRDTWNSCKSCPVGTYSIGNVSGSQNVGCINCNGHTSSVTATYQDNEGSSSCKNKSSYDPYCNTFTEDKTIATCTQCANNYQLVTNTYVPTTLPSPNNPLCIKSIPSCNLYTNISTSSSSSCSTCTSTTTPTDTNRNKLISLYTADFCLFTIDNCDTYSSSSTDISSTCATCSPSSIPVNSDFNRTTTPSNLCIIPNKITSANGLANCSSFTGSSGDIYCNACSNGNFLLEETTFLKKDNNDTDNALKGIACIDNSKNISNCTHYTDTNATYCKSCNDGIMLNASFEKITQSTSDNTLQGKYCSNITEIPNCRKYTDAHMTRCANDGCETGFLISADGRCIQPIANCTPGAQYYNTDGTCNACQNGYTPFNSLYQNLKDTSSYHASYCRNDNGANSCNIYAVPFTNCSVCTDINNVPIATSSPFSIDNSNANLCKTRKVDNCASFTNANGDYCDKCDTITSYVLIEEGTFGVKQPSQQDANSNSGRGKWCKIETIPNCSFYTNENLEYCKTCGGQLMLDEQYNKVINNGKFCPTSIEINECIKYRDTTLTYCERCKDGFLPSIDNSTCIAPTVPNCRDMDNNGNCIGCNHDYIGFNNVFEKTIPYTYCKYKDIDLIENCNKYENSTFNSCAVCNLPLSPSSPNKDKCVANNTIPNCNLYSNTGLCYECDTNYVPFNANHYTLSGANNYDASYCVSITNRDNNCIQYSNDFMNCNECSNDYHLITSSTSNCAKNIPFCEDYDISSPRCAKCVNGAFLSDEFGMPAINVISAPLCVSIILKNPSSIKAFSESQLVNILAINNLANLISTDAVRTALDIFKQDNNKSVAMFGVNSGGYNKYNTGSSITMSSFNTLWGLAFNLNALSPRTMFALFGNWGGSNYNTDNDGYKGSGDSNVKGGGIILHKMFANAYFLQGSIYGGYIENNFKAPHLYITNYDELMCSNNLWGNINFDCASAIEYANKSKYYGASFGVGKVYEISERDRIDLTLKYIYSIVKGNTITLANGDLVTFDNVISNRIRIGSKYTGNLVNNTSPTENKRNKKQNNNEFILDYFIGLDLEYELSALQKSNIAGNRQVLNGTTQDYFATPFAFKIDEPTSKGYSAIIELGLNSSINKYLNINLSATGTIGNKNTGAGGTFGIRYIFGTNNKINRAPSIINYNYNLIQYYELLNMIRNSNNIDGTENKNTVEKKDEIKK